MTTSYTLLSAKLLLCLALFTPPSSAMDFPGMDGAGKPCRMYSCSKGYAPVPKKRTITKFTSPGCDAMGGGMLMMNPGAKTSEKPYESCCDQWHACYQICGSHKQQCDKTYDDCVATTCGADSECSESSKLNSMLMQLGGCQKYEQAQNQACDCVSKDKDKHVVARKDVLEKFYKKYAPDSVHKVPDLAKKADTAGKLAVLIQKLVKKYPESIQKIEDPQAAEMRKMMDDVKVNSDKGEDNAGDEDIGSEEEVEDLDSGANEEL
jgi:hypothetical protein